MAGSRLDTRIRGLFESELAEAKQDVFRVLRMMPLADKELMMAGFEAEFRGEPEPEGVAEVMDRFEDLGGLEAHRRVELLETDADRAQAAEFRSRVVAGENWKQITR